MTTREFPTKKLFLISPHGEEKIVLCDKEIEKVGNFSNIF